ncbi:MAG TPA: Hsp20/alpha crystallin family protein [Vicinamibacterales bacterium]|jgi:HSP20 family protein|nr:Hsp20/alpha crystallin family protein [Vicinamibacterales bacterium]
MTITRFDPFREFTTLQDRMNRLFGDVYLRDEELTSRGNWVPPVDIYETEGHDLVIKVELPDVNREDVQVTVENNTITIKGNKTFPGDVKEEQFRRVERRYGSFVRSFTLPNTVDATKVSAEYKNGVLTVKLPYRDEAKPRTINVEVAA